RSVPLAVPNETRETLAQLVGQKLARARFSVHPCLHVAADVHALGMMLLTSLLVHHGRPLAEVARAIDEVAQRLALGARGLGTADEQVLADEAARCVRSDAFAKLHLFAHPEHHQAASAAVPDDLWRDTLVTGLRAVTTLRGFSICRSAADFDPAHPEVKVE